MDACSYYLEKDYPDNLLRLAINYGNLTNTTYAEKDFEKNYSCRSLQCDASSDYLYKVKERIVKENKKKIHDTYYSKHGWKH